ncbi:MAG: DUF481 domain-containing protein [Bacteroidetes bacterium]|nr:DUF481 domain-containing protein [Bacteroidota bacterium]
MEKAKTFGCVILLAFALLSPNLRAQLNESDTLRFQLRWGAGGSHQTGNVEFFTLRSRAELVFAISPELRIKSQNNSLYQAFGSRRADNDLSSRNFLYFRPEAKVYPFAMVFVQRNFRRKIDQRLFAGAGFTWQAIRNPKGYLKFSASLVGEETLFADTRFSDSRYDGSRKISVWRPTLYATTSTANADQKFRLHGTAYWQPGLDKVPNNRISLELGADVSVWKGLMCNLLYVYGFEQVVPVAVRQRDGLLTFGFSYQIKSTTRP